MVLAETTRGGTGIPVQPLEGMGPLSHPGSPEGGQRQGSPLDTLVVPRPSRQFKHPAPYTDAFDDPEPLASNRSPLQGGRPG